MFSHTSVCHTVVFCFNYYRKVFGLSIFFQFICDLCGHLLLYLRSLYNVMHYPVELTQTNYFTIWNNTYPGISHNVLEVMGTRRSNTDRTTGVHTLVTHIGKTCNPRRWLEPASERFSDVHLGHTFCSLLRVVIVFCVNH